MKIKLAAMLALVLLLAPAAFASEAELAEIQRPVDMTASTVLNQDEQAAPASGQEEVRDITRHEEV